MVVVELDVVDHKGKDRKKLVVDLKNQMLLVSSLLQHQHELHAGGSNCFVEKSSQRDSYDIFEHHLANSSEPQL